MVDAYDRYFMSWIDDLAEYSLPIVDEIAAYAVTDDQGDMEIDEKFFERRRLPSIKVATCRIFYTVKHHCNQGLQRKAFSEINKYADEFSEAYSIVSDPFVIKDGEYTNERNARHAIVKLATKHYEPAPNYMQELDEQRKRFLSYGLKNCEYANAEVINEYQSFLYCPKTASDDVKELVKRIEVSYELKRRDEI